MNSETIRKRFIEYFEKKGHYIVKSAPMVVKNDPTLMFTNAGMNQFKDIFLGNTSPKYKRVVNTQKCLRVSGKHNDLEEVGHDAYHHTMFEMLGNWSFGDYFKKEAISWAWELLTKEYNIDGERLYVTVFEGDESNGLEPDNEAYDIWKTIVPGSRILYGSKKDNFWEMGDTGPCGPCSEIHIDIRDDDARKKLDGSELVNKEHPEVIEIWNLVFIEFNRKADDSLLPLPAKHVDTGMGFERLCMVLQDKRSNYDTDLFKPIIDRLSEITSLSYGKDDQTCIAMRVVADHLRAVAFAIADGELPSNTGAGYVIRRILRRAVRYGYTFLGMSEPFVYELLPLLVNKMGRFFPELAGQEDLIGKVIKQEEQIFLRTLAVGIQKFEEYVKNKLKNNIVDGKFAFELFDTYGFPIDLTTLMAREKGLQVDMKGFDKNMKKQKERSRAVGVKQAVDWVDVRPNVEQTKFTGYDSLETEAGIVKYREVKVKGKSLYHIVLDRTPFYAESGGQVGDRGVLASDGGDIKIVDTQKENELIIHIAEKLPTPVPAKVIAKVDKTKRLLTANNHSATHLMHSALRQVLGEHAQQKGSLVDEKRLRFDFAHFEKVTPEQIIKIEKIVNEKIRQNIEVEDHRDISLEGARNMGATALFGEKYDELARVIAFDRDYSAELCGGTHVARTGQIGFFKIISEAAIAAGIRRIEAVTGHEAEKFVNSRFELIEQLSGILKHPKNLKQAVEKLVENNESLEKKVDQLQKARASQIKQELIKKLEKTNNVNFIGATVDMDAKTAKDIAFELKQKVDDLFLVLAYKHNNKPGIAVMLSDNLVKSGNLHAGEIVKELAKEINGGGGGQPFFATAGGKNLQGLEKVVSKARGIAAG